MLTNIWAVPLKNAHFTIASVGSGLFELPTALFANRANENAGFTRLVTISPLDIGNDLLDLGSPLFASYDLLFPIGPIFDPTPFAFNQFENVPTSLGTLTFFDVRDVTFQTTLVPEPNSVLILAGGGLALVWARRRRAD